MNIPTLRLSGVIGNSGVLRSGLNLQGIDKLLDNTNDETFLLYDTGHILFAQGDYEKILNKYIKRINHIH